MRDKWTNRSISRQLILIILFLLERIVRKVWLGSDYGIRRSRFFFVKNFNNAHILFSIYLMCHILHMKSAGFFYIFASYNCIRHQNIFFCKYPLFTVGRGNPLFNTLWFPLSAQLLDRHCLLSGGSGSPKWRSYSQPSRSLQSGNRNKYLIQ